MLLTDWAEQEGHILSVRGGSLLIENPDPVTWTNARLFNQVYLLRWRYRSCRICGSDFDISDGGFAYTCPSCQKLEVPL